MTSTPAAPDRVYTACLLIIGNEVLSGRTRDANLQYIAEKLNAWGVRLREARVIPDVEQTIVDTVNEVRAKFDYVFTTGGIGPTHDDITAGCVAKAFGVKLYQNEEAVRLMAPRFKPGEFNEARQRMTYVPEGATLILNAVSAAPGFQIGNVFVMAGVPSIMRAMMDTLQNRLVGGTPVESRTVNVYLPEGTIAEGLGKLQDKNPTLDIGSYPFYRDGKFGTSLVLRGTEIGTLEQATDELCALIASLGAEPQRA